MVWSKYRIEFGCVDGRMGAYLGTTIQQVHQAIYRDNQLSDIEKDILCFGYFKEFKNKPYETKDYVIDNGYHIFWVVKEETGYSVGGNK